jgi:hypothetical protein
MHPDGDGTVEQHKVAGAVSDWPPHLHLLNIIRLQRRIRVEDAAGFPAFGGCCLSIGGKQGDLQQKSSGSCLTVAR